MDTDSMMETMKSSFIHNFRTGNVVIDTLVTGLIIMMSSYILSLANSLLNLDIMGVFKYFRMKYKSSAKIVITGDLNLNFSIFQSHYIVYIYFVFLFA